VLRDRIPDPLLFASGLDARHLAVYRIVSVSIRHADNDIGGFQWSVSLSCILPQCGQIFSLTSVGPMP
jgi:hypothetical protein